MVNSTETKTNGKAEREAEAKARSRAEQAQIVAGLKTVLEGDEQLLGFARGVISGGVRGKLTVGLEAFFAPYVNIGLTERRLILQHIHAETGKPSEILPHTFPLGELAAMTFSDIETFGAETACRLTLRLHNDQHFRLRLRGPDNVTSAQTLSEVFHSLIASRPYPRTTPTQSVCPHCDHILDRPSKFCPYCGRKREESSIPDTTEETGAQGTTTVTDTPEPGTTAAVSGEAVASAVAEPVAAVVPEPTADISPEPTAAASPEPIADASPEPTAAAAPEPIPTAVAEPIAEPVVSHIEEAHGVPSGEDEERNFLFPGEMADARPVPPPLPTVEGPEETEPEGSGSIYSAPNTPAPSGLETISEAPSDVAEARLETPNTETSPTNSWHWLSGLRKSDSDTSDQGIIADTPTVIDMPAETYTEAVPEADKPPVVPPLPNIHNIYSTVQEWTGNETTESAVETATFLPPDASPASESEALRDLPTEGHEPLAQASEENSQEEPIRSGEEGAETSPANEEGSGTQANSPTHDYSTPPASQTHPYATQTDITSFGAEGPPAGYGDTRPNSPQGGH